MDAAIVVVACCFGLSFAAWTCGYVCGKRFAIWSIKRHLRESANLHIDTAAQLIGEIDGRPWDWVRNEINNEIEDER